VPAVSYTSDKYGGDEWVRGLSKCGYGNYEWASRKEVLAHTITRNKPKPEREGCN